MINNIYYLFISLFIFINIGCGSKHTKNNMIDASNGGNKAFVFNQSMGPSVSGGGDAVVCLDQKGNIKSAQLFDLYEGEILYNYDYESERTKNLTYENWISIFQKRIGKTGYANEIKSHFEVIHLNLLTGRNFIKNAVLNEVSDEANVLSPADGCQIVQLARYLSPNSVLIQKNIWDHLSAFDQASLVVHETFYSIDRVMSSVLDSRYARYLTSTFVEDDNEKEIGVDLNKIPPVLCEGSSEPIDSEYSVLRTKPIRGRRFGLRRGDTLFYMQSIKGLDLGGTGPLRPDTDFIEIRFLSLNGRMLLKSTPAFIENYIWSDIVTSLIHGSYLSTTGLIFFDREILRVNMNEGIFQGSKFGVMNFTADSVTSEFPLVTREDTIYYKCYPSEVYYPK